MALSISRPLPVDSLVYRWLRKHCRFFLLLFMLDGHNGTVRILLSVSCVVAAIALPLL
jgi:hypothetical protein